MAEELGQGAAALAGAETGGLLTSELGPLAVVGAAVGAGIGLLTAALTGENVCTTRVSAIRGLAHLLPLDELLRLWEPQKWILRTIWGL